MPIDLEEPLYDADEWIANPPVDLSCFDCRFYDCLFNTETGRCRRRSPLIHPTWRAEAEDDEWDWAAWPMVHYDDWCGEHERASEQIIRNRIERANREHREKLAKRNRRSESPDSPSAA